MRVVINGLAALKTRTGVGHYVARLHEQLAADSRGDSFSLYPGETLGKVATFANRLLSPKSACDTGTRTIAARVKSTISTTAKHAAKVAIEIHFARQCRSFGYDLYHEPNFIPLSSPLPTVVTVHDLSVLLHPEWHPIDRVRHHERHFETAIRRAAHVVVVSEEIRREMIEIIGLSARKVTAIHNGIGDEFYPRSPTDIDATRQRLGLPDSYFLCVGTVEPRKNLMVVLKAFADLPATVRERCPLVLAGPWGWKSSEERDFYETTARHIGAMHIGYVAHNDLPTVYAGATALLYPSHYEGFGLPPIEMLACGSRVVCSTSAMAVREVVGKFGNYLDPHDVPAWRDTMNRIALNEVSDMYSPAARTAHAAKYTWEAAATKTHNVYRAVLGKPVQKPQFRRAA